MNEQDWNLVGIVRMKQVDASRNPWIIGSEEGSCGASATFRACEYSTAKVAV